MSPPGPRPPALPESAYRRMSDLLRAGLLLALVILTGALVGYLAALPNATLATAISSNPILGYLGLGGLARGLAAGAPAAYLTLGLIALVATPILRVASGCYYFRRNGERTMGRVTLAVLVLLLFGILVLGPLIR
jgi:uncharacterized membrane protein